MHHKRPHTLAQKCERSFWQIDFCLEYLMNHPLFSHPSNNHFLKSHIVPFTSIGAWGEIPKPEWEWVGSRGRKDFLEEKVDA